MSEDTASRDTRPPDGYPDPKAQLVFAIVRGIRVALWSGLELPYVVIVKLPDGSTLCSCAGKFNEPEVIDEFDTVARQFLADLADGKIELEKLV